MNKCRVISLQDYKIKKRVEAERKRQEILDGRRKLIEKKKSKISFLKSSVKKEIKRRKVKLTLV